MRYLITTQHNRYSWPESKNMFITSFNVSGSAAIKLQNNRCDVLVIPEASHLFNIFLLDDPNIIIQYWNTAVSDYYHYYWKLLKFCYKSIYTHATKNSIEFNQ